MATELAKAYVQIVPSAQGITGSIRSVLDPEAQSAGQASGQGLGGRLVGALKGVLATAAIGKALGAAISEGAALEQSLGGVETLFGASADRVVQNAQSAYRTAGLSANAYMEQVTSFTASLLQGLGGDTEAAAAAADTALQDMADNANKFGTDMTSIQMAYQGFARQNYTMLDNLKIGYGGTKTEMERLLADAEAFSGVHYDIDNLADVYAAIHVIQGEMEVSGRTAEEAAAIYERTGREVGEQMGTTAKEAATTLSGSLASMKAAFKNVLGGLTLGQDIGPALSALGSTVVTFLAGNLLPAVFNILSALPAGLLALLSEGLPALASALGELLPGLFDQLAGGLSGAGGLAIRLLQQLAEALLANLPVFAAAAPALLGSLSAGVLEALPVLYETALGILTQLTAGLIENLPLLLQSGAALLGGLLSGFSEALPQMALAAAGAAGTLLQTLAEHLPQILSAGFGLLVSLVQGIGNALPKLVTAAGQIVKKIWDAVKQVDWLALGKSIVQGLIDGIGAMAGALWEAAKNLAHRALDAIKDALGIHSPSRVMREQVGRFIPAGIAQGIRQNQGAVTSAMEELSAKAASVRAALSYDLSAAGRLPALAGAGAAGTTTNLYQNIYTHDSLSESELTREAEDLLARSKWGLP